MMFRFFIITICIFLSIPSSARNNITISKSSNDIQSIFSKKKRTYIINQIIDLDQKELPLPQGPIIKFSNGGKFINGTIYGNNSTIVSSKSDIFDNIKIDGQWKNNIVKLSWFKMPQKGTICNAQLQSSLNLCNGSTLTHLYTDVDTIYVESIYRSAPINIPSNVYWHNSSTIIMKPSRYEKYNIVLLDKSENITIEGGTFIGDANDHLGNTGEWGHGIKCGGAKNISIKNIIISNCWGDGIDLIEGLDVNGEATINCENILIENIKCLNNRRQGMSIEAVHNVKINNCEFAYTGIPKTTSPSAGLDLEPWNGNGDKIKNVLITNSIFHHNVGHDLFCTANSFRSNFDNYENDIKISDCNIGKLTINNASDVTIINTNITDNLYIIRASDILFDNCNINKYEIGSKVSNYKFENCKIGTPDNH